MDNSRRVRNCTSIKLKRYVVIGGKGNAEGKEVSSKHEQGENNEIILPTYVFKYRQVTKPTYISKPYTQP
jgi:hypothetical protein